MFHNIVVAVDGSANAERALMHAIDLSECGHGRLTIFTAAVEPPALAYWAPIGMTDTIETAETQAATIASQAPRGVSLITCPLALASTSSTTARFRCWWSTPARRLGARPPALASTIARPSTSPEAYGYQAPTARLLGLSDRA